MRYKIGLNPDQNNLRFTHFWSGSGHTRFPMDATEFLVGGVAAARALRLRKLGAKAVVFSEADAPWLFASLPKRQSRKTIVIKEQAA